jgi:hypothetical protein
MSFSLPRFLRHIRPSDLEDYFEQRDIRFPEPFDRNAAPAKLLACLKAAIEALPDAQRERVFEDFERIDQLTDDIGQCSLLALAEADGALLRRFQSCHGRQAHGLLALLANEEAFDRALATAYPSACDPAGAGVGTNFRGPLRQAAIQPISSCSKQTCGRYSGNLMAPGAS